MKGEEQFELVLGDETTSCGSWLVSCTTLVKMTKYLQGYVECPKITSVSTAEGSCAMAVEKMVVHLSKNQDLVCIQMKHKVDDLAILEGGYLVMGDNSGSLTIGVVQTNGDGSAKFCIKSSEKVVQCSNNSGQDCVFRRVLFRLTDKDVGQVIALTSAGSFIIVSDIDLLDGDVSLGSSSVQTESVPKSSIDVVTCGDSFVLLGSGESAVNVYTLEDSHITQVDAACQYENTTMTRIFPSGAGTFFTMDANGNLYVWDLLLLIVVATFSLVDNADTTDCIKDLKLISSLDDNSVFSMNSVSAAVLTKTSLRVLQFPSLECSFELKTENDNVLFLSQSPICQSDIFATQCSRDYDDDDDETNLSIKFLCYAETDPERRLNKLLSRKQFDEAQQLIEMYNLRVDITPHLVQYCMHDTLPTLSDTEELLKSCRKQIDECEEKDDLILGISSELNELTYRLRTFVTVFGEQAYSSDEWQTFQHADILEMFVSLLTSHKYHQAFDLWHCHQLDLISRLKPRMVGKILQGVSSASSAVCDKALDWLVKDIIPFLVWSESLSDDLIPMVQWTLGVVSSMENSQSDWLSNGIAFCHRMLTSLRANTFKPTDEEAGLWIQMTSTSRDEELIQSLYNTLASLKTIDELKTRYNCHLSLEIVRKETKESLVYRMLDKVKVVESLPMILQTQILPYVEHHGIKVDQVFAEYIKDMLFRVSRSPFDDASWSLKVKAIIDVIQAPKEKVTAVLNLVENSHLPFADFVKDLVASVVDNVKHPLTANLQERWQTLQASNLLSLYGLEPYTVTPRKALEVARYFIRQDRKTSMADAKMFLKAVGIEDDATLAQYQAMHYIKENRLSDLLDYVKSLPPAVGHKCANWCLSMGEMNMTSYRYSQPSGEKLFKESRLKFFSAGILCANFLKNEIKVQDSLELERIEEIEGKLQTAMVLEKEYDIGLDRFALDDRDLCIGIFKKQLGEKHSEAVLMRIAELLRIGREKALCCMIDHAAQEGSTETVNRLTTEVCELTNDTSSNTCYDTSLRHLSLDQPRLIAPAKAMATHALLTCRGGEIQSRLELTKQIALMERLHLQCQDVNEGLSGHLTVEEKDADWFDSCYNEMRMPLSWNQVSGAYKCLAEMRREPDLLAVGETRHSLTEITSTLLSYGHENLSLDILNHVQHKSLQCSPENREEVKATKILIEKALSKVSSRMLSKVLKNTPSDRELCLPLTLQLKPSHVLNMLTQETTSTASINHSRFKKILEISLAYGELREDNNLIERCLELGIQEKWWNRLSKLGLSLGPKPSKKAVLQVMITLLLDSNTNFSLIQEFAIEMDLDEALVDMEFESNFHKVLSQAPVSHVALEKAQAILGHITDDANRLAIIKDALLQTSEYNYEVLQFLMEQWETLEKSKTNRKGMDLLKLLSDYERVSPPCSIEEEDTNIGSSSDMLSGAGIWASFSTDSAPSTSSAAVIASKVAAWERQQKQKRLPFRLMQGKRMGKIMESELTLATLPSWLLITSALGTPKDKILVSLASKLVISYTKSLSINSNTACGEPTSAVGQSPVEDDGLVSAEFESLIKEIGPILLRVEMKEYGSWLCQATADKLTKIGDKVRMLENGLCYAKRWMEDADQPEEKSKAEKTMKVFASKLAPLSTVRALIRAGIKSWETLQSFVSQPEQLIRQLYHLPLKSSIMSRMEDNWDVITLDGDENYDENTIHAVCEEIADLHDLDLQAIQESLIDLWLTGSDSPTSYDADQTLFNVSTEFQLGCDTDDGLPRIVSMLRCSNGSSNSKHLMELLSNDNGCLSLNSRCMAIQCLSEVDQASLPLRQELKPLRQLIALQSLGIHFTVDMFAQVNKEPLLIGLWDKYQGQPKAVTLIASLCLDQGLTTPELWNKILLQLVKFNQKTSLRPILMRLTQMKGLELVRRTEGFLKARTIQL